jgi:CheY-like chemotaxis protein
MVTKTDISARILLAEDDLAGQKVALAMLKWLGYEADSVNNGIEVLQVLKRTKYDLVLMDIVMLEMDGITATQEIHRRFPASELPKIIAFTAYVHPDIKKKCLEVGMDDYIIKPVKLNELRNVLIKYLPESFSSGRFSGEFPQNGL